MTNQHVKQRALERYGIALTDSEINQMNKEIIGNNSLHLEYREGQKSIRIFKFNDLYFLAVFSLEDEFIITLLPPTSHFFPTAKRKLEALIEYRKKKGIVNKSSKYR